MFPQVSPQMAASWPALQLCVRVRACRRTHSEGLMGCNLKLRKLSCRVVCGLLSSVSHASDRESGAKAGSCLVDSSVARS